MPLAFTQEDFLVVYCLWCVFQFLCFQDRKDECCQKMERKRAIIELKFV